MRIIAKRTLRQFWESSATNRAARTPLQDWHARTKDADWASPADLKADFGDASVLKGGRVVFNIGGNKYRLVAAIAFVPQLLWVKAILTHADYDKGAWK